MNYLLIEKSACHELVQNRFFQNLGFPSARELVAVIRGSASVLKGFSVHTNTRGTIITSEKGKPESDSLTFDLETLSITSDCNDTDLLVVLQKTLRLAVKYWGGLALSSGEMYLKGSTKALVFPFAYVANRSGYRITIEREPNAKRLSKRTDGRYLLAYKSGKSEGDGANEEASLTNFRRAFDDFAGVRDKAFDRMIATQGTSSVSALGVTTLSSNNSNIPADQGFSTWKNLLTDEQQTFVESDWSVPHRLEGPAGTGKTLCLVLKAINILQKARSSNAPHKSIFVVPSDELAETIKNRFNGNGAEDFIVEATEPNSNKSQSIEVTTLQRLCARLLNYEIEDAEFLDRDSVESKNTQLLYLDQIVSDLKSKDLPVISKFLSKEFHDFLSCEDAWTLAQLLRHEVSVVIKGRANGSLDTYKSIPALEYGLPVRTAQDKEFIYRKYVDYQKQLESSNQYDIDDIVISAIGQLDTPIWRRRRQQLGFDSIFIDEVHLFNLNEVSVLHYLTKNHSSVPISYSIDRSQALGDIGWNDREFYEALGTNQETGTLHNNSVSAVFRSSREIVELAFCVTSSGASLFTNFENPLDMATETFTAEEERKCAKPCITYISDDKDLPQTVYKQVDGMAKNLQAGKDNILVVVFDDQLLASIKDDWRQANRGFKSLEKRGDFSTITEANKAGFPVISSPELVGGLEFCGVVLVGCEKGRLPQAGCASDFGKAYINYRAHNNLYVSITRAKYRVEFIVNQNRGLSEILKRALDNQLITEDKASNQI